MPVSMDSNKMTLLHLILNYSTDLSFYSNICVYYAFPGTDIKKAAI